MIASPVAESGPWSLGTLIGLPAAAITFVALIAFAVWGFRSYYGDAFIGWGAVAVAVIVPIGTAAAMWPYDSEYHQWRAVTGAVERVDSRQIADGDGMSERYVFVIDGQPFSVDDTRAATVDKGDTVSLRCKREWQYAAASGWACRWSGHE